MYKYSQPAVNWLFLAAWVGQDQLSHVYHSSCVGHSIPLMSKAGGPLNCWLGCSLGSCPACSAQLSPQLHSLGVSSRGCSLAYMLYSYDQIRFLHNQWLSQATCRPGMTITRAIITSLMCIDPCATLKLPQSRQLGGIQMQTRYSN